MLAERLILAIEDDDAAFDRLELAFHEVAPHIRLRWARDRDETVSILREAEEVSHSKPHLIPLNLNLPKRIGYAVLEKIKSDPHSRSIPVVAFYSPSAKTAKAKCLALGTERCYIKPSTFEEALLAVRSLCDREHSIPWGQAALLSEDAGERTFCSAGKTE